MTANAQAVTQTLFSEIQFELNHLSEGFPQTGKKLMREPISIEEVSAKLVQLLQNTKGSTSIFSRLEACRQANLGDKEVETLTQKKHDEVVEFFSKREATYRDLGVLKLLRKRFLEEEDCDKENTFPSEEGFQEAVNYPSVNRGLRRDVSVLQPHRYSLSQIR